MTLEQAQVRILQLELELTEMTRQRDKFRAEWQEALTWLGHFKRQSRSLKTAMSNPEGFASRREQMMAAKRAAMDGASVVKV